MGLGNIVVGIECPVVSIYGSMKGAPAMYRNIGFNGAFKEEARSKKIYACLILLLRSVISATTDIAGWEL